MLPQCVRAAIVALGKDVSKAELDGIEERMLSSMRELSRKDPTAWQGLTREQRLLQAGELSRSKYTADVLQAQARTVRDMATRTKQLRLTDSFKPGKVGQLAALRQRLTMQNRYGGDIALDQQVKAVYNDFTRELDGGKLKGRFFTLVQDPTQQRTLTKAIFGESTGKPDIDMLGQQVRDVLERARTTANDAGVVINHLDNWNLPQPWAWEKVGADRTQFVKDMLAEIDPNSYVNRDGSPMTGEQIRKLIEASAETLGTNGANKRGKAMGSGYGGGVGSSRNAPRQLHFKNADGYIRMMEKYGSSNNVLSMLDHHFHGLARDIATTRSYGAAADRFVPQLIERAFAADAKSGPTSTDLIYKVLADDAKPGQSVPEMALRAAAPDAEAQLTIAQRKRLDTLKQKTASAQESKLKHLDNLKRQTTREYEALRNPGHPGALPLWAQVSNTVRGVVGSTLLGGSTLAAIPDAGMAIAYGHELGLSKRALLGNMKEGVKPTKANLEYIRRLGITANTMLEGTHRFGAGELSNQATRFLNHGVHVLSLLRMWDRAQTHGFSASLMDLLGKKVGESDHASLDAKDQAYLASRGVTADHYATWKQAELDTGPSGQHTMLTPDAIYSIPNEKLRPIAEARMGGKATAAQIEEDVRRLKSEAAQHLLALTISESQIGARGGSGNSIRDNITLHITPDNAGTIQGQIARWFYFLKQTPLGIFRTHMLDVPGGMNDWKSAWAYRARFMAYSASLGALALTAKSIILGNDPENLATPKGLAKVAIASGGFGMYGDFLFGDNTEHSSNGFVKTLGPGATFLSDAYDAFHATADEAQGEGSTKPGQYGAKMLKLARNYAMPFSRLWYAKAAFNHMVYQQQMEKLSPGYNARVRQRMARAHQNTWWQSGNMTPDRAPNMGAAIGQP